MELLNGQWEKRGIKIFEIESPDCESYDCEKGFIIDNICFVLPQGLCKDKEICIQTIVNYLDYGFESSDKCRR